MSEYFIAHTKKIEIVSWKTEADFWFDGSEKKLMKTKAEFFKDLLPGDVLEISFELRSTSNYKASLTVKAWRGDVYIGERTDTFNMIAGAMLNFNLREL